MKSVGRGPLGRGEAGVKVGDNDLGQMTSKSGEKTFLSRDEILHVPSPIHINHVFLVFRSTHATRNICDSLVSNWPNSFADMSTEQYVN